MSRESLEFHLSLLSAFASNGVDTENPRREEKLDTHTNASSVTPSGGRRQQHADIPLLDALAAICVQKSGQAYAVTMSLSAQQVNLFVAANKQVPRNVVDHLEDIWASVTEISRDVRASQQRRHHRSFHLCSGDQDFGALAMKVYAFSLPRLQKRLEKRWPILLLFLEDCEDTFGSHLVASVYQLHETLASEQPHVAEILLWLDAMSNYLAHIKFDQREAQWSLLEKDWIVKNRDIVYGWRGGRDIQFAPHRCIAKLLSLHEHLKSIIRTARSRRLSAYLRQSTLKVICVAPHASEGVQVPTTEDIQAAIRENIDIPPSDDKYETLIGQLSRNTTFIPSALCNVKANAHYECAMLAYHLQHPDTFPLRYIGTSKPLCFACQTLFKLYNQHARNFNQRPFYFKEMNWKLRPGWVSVDFKADGDGVPQSAIDLLDRIREDMVAEIKVWVQTHVRHKAKVTQEGEAKCKALLATMAARIKEAKLQRCAQMAKGSDASE